MTRILIVNSGPYGCDSHGYRLANRMIADAGWDRVELTVRDLVRTPITPIGSDYAHAITSNQPHDASAFVESEALISELERHDVLFIVTPMHNFTVPAALKLWLDHIIRINRSFTATPHGKVGSLKDRPTFVLVSSGGFHVGDRARQVDFLTPYLKYALASIGIENVHFIPLQGLVFGDEAVASAIGEAMQAFRAHVHEHPYQSRTAGSLG
ncbi:FMN-dependent NADH-azoreductase [Schauerella aestuarii]|uniref:FMN-dependent NADH-azoreductase n=1 Tax=Schauerella aestuarii TaxID=2511204 RepID=UPI00136E3E0C|nr:NAD(P)H-dependent oxidoreductase [Achromobacter aestuarii]MYZ43585.1 flavodoxin family protein [Achromobacter aestuarii]